MDTPQAHQAPNPKPVQKAGVRDVIQKIVKPNIGCLGIVRAVDDIGVTAINRSSKVNDVSGAEIFSLAHGEYAVIGKAVIHLPKDPPDVKLSLFDAKAIPSEVAPTGTAPIPAEAAISAAIDVPPPQDAAPVEQTPPSPHPALKELASEPRPTPPGAPTLIPKVTQAQREAIGGVTVAGNHGGPATTQVRLRKIPNAEPTQNPA